MRFGILLGIAGLAAVADHAPAQSRNLSSRGTGSLQRSNAATIQLYQVTYQQSVRSFNLTFLGRNSAIPIVVAGLVTGNATGDGLAVRVTSGLGDKGTEGTGRVVLSGRNVARVELQGNGSQGPFTLRFQGEGEAGGGEYAGAKPVDQSARGNGVYEWAGQRYNLVDMRTRLYEDRRAELSFSGDRNVSGRGTWASGPRGDAQIALTEWNGRRVSGTATVRFRGNAVERIDVSVPAQNARVEFSTNGYDVDWGSGGAGAEPINLSTRGRGTYQLAGRPYNLNEMRIRLYDDGRAELGFEGNRKVEVTGTWRRGYDGRADINVLQLNGRRAGGTASVTYSGREVARVDVNSPDQNTRVEFYPSRGTGGRNEAVRPVNVSFVGAGTFTDQGRRYALDEASVRLRNNGEAELRFRGERQTRGRGRWTANGNYAALTIQEWDGRTTSGTGNIGFAAGHPQQITITLRELRRSISFRATQRIQPR